MLDPGGDRLDWIERLFGVSPDGGNGMLELAVLVVVVLVILTAVRLVPAYIRERRR